MSCEHLAAPGQPSDATKEPSASTSPDTGDRSTAAGSTQTRGDRTRKVDEVTFATAAHPEARRAAEFAERFRPVDGVAYEWVEEYAQEQYEKMYRTFTSLDAKATSIINYLSSGAGLFTLGTLAGISAAKVPTHVVWWAVPSMVAAVVAIVFALMARWPRRVFPLPCADELTRLAEQFGSNDSEGKGARAMMIPQWQWVTALLGAQVDDKAWYVGWATVLMGLTIAMLLFPVLASLGAI